MLIRSRHNLHYPITVSTIKAPTDARVERLGELFTYKYRLTEKKEDEFGGAPIEVEKWLMAGFESATSGTVVRWFVREGDVVTGPGQSLVEIEEPCRHEIQWGGMCANCGQDMTLITYAQAEPDSERATIGMSHGHAALKVSRGEAARADDESKRRLLASEKLSLVVDLDQTIIQATVDPTVADWQKDESNPNHDAVKDVRAFQLFDDHSGRQTWYYIKLRPGLEDFLKNISKLYELHVYTMGTRAYAENIAKIVDPDRHIFGDRILSRNESGSEREKKLERLFPVDTKMVVIIDDRGDVWNWSPNLVKVKPYDFFIGIGDINSSFLPKRTEPLPTLPASPPTTEPTTAESDESQTNGNGKQPEVVPDPVPAVGGSAVQASLASLTGSRNPEALADQASQQDETIAAQIEERPLLQKQLQLDQADEAAAAKDGETGDPSTQSTDHPRHNLLHDDDNVLDDLETALRQIHRTFYDEYNARLSASKGGRVNELKSGQFKRPSASKSSQMNTLELLPDVGLIMPPMKTRVLEGVNLVFTGVIPLGHNVHFSDIGRWVTTFGARITDHITRKTTHVVAARNRRTAKARQAARHKWIKIVGLDWLYESISQWSKLDESIFEIHVEPDADSHDAAPGIDEMVDTGGMLSDSDNDGTEHGTDTNSEMLDDDEEPQSAIPKSDEWDDMAKEMEDFMNDTDGEGTEADDDTSSNDGAASDGDDTTSPKGSPRKRKRPDQGNPSAEDDGTNDSDASTKSRLQKRRKKAMERTTSLSTMVPAPDGDQAASDALPSPDSTGPEEGAVKDGIDIKVSAVDGAVKIAGKVEGDSHWTDDPADEGDADEDDLEAEMMAAFEDDGEDE